MREHVSLKLKQILEATGFAGQVVKALYQVIQGRFRNLTELTTHMWIHHEEVLGDFDPIDNTDVPFDPLHTKAEFNERVAFHNPDTAYHAVAIAYWPQGNDHYIRLLADTSANEMWTNTEHWYWRN